MLNIKLISPFDEIGEKIEIENLENFLQNFVQTILQQIDVEIRHLINTKNEGIIVTPVDTDS